MIKRLFIFLNLGLITLGIYFGTSLFYQVIFAEMLSTGLYPGQAAGHGKEAQKKQAGSSGEQAGSRRYSDYRAILDRNLFRTSAENEPEADRREIQLNKLKETELNLRLWGTVTGDSGTKRAYAVIEDKNKNEQGLYHEGDTIQNARIKMILRKKVVLTVDGRDEILVMEGRENRGQSDSGGARAAASSGRADFSIERERINSVLNNINKLMRQAKARPYFKNGKPGGILLTSIRPNSFFTELGLQNGDIIKGVNGKEIRSVDDALEFYHGLRSSSSVELQIQRHGREQSITYQIY